MTKAAPVPFWLPPISLLGIVLITCLISFSPWRFDPFAVTGQACLLIIGLRIFCYWAPFVSWVKSMPIIHRAVFGLSIAGMIIGHYTIDSRTYFPFVSWEIFPAVHEVDPVTCPEFIATTTSGRKVRLLVEQLFPSIVQIYPLDDAKHFPPGSIDRLVPVIAKAYNDTHASDPVQQIDLMLVAVHLHPSANESHAQPPCELLKSYDVSSAR